MLTIGSWVMHPHKIEQTIFNTLVRFMSCHQAYIRSIAQYHIMKYIEAKPRQGGFLQHLVTRVWKEDKDCIKIMKNVGFVVEGFKQAVEASPPL